MMNHQPEIAIVEANTLTSLGLKTILERMIPMAVIRTFHSFGELTDDTPDMYAHYFISAQIYVEHNAFFLPRKRKTIVLAGDSHQFQLSGVPILNIYQAEEQLVKDILKLHQHAHHDGYPVKDMPPTPPTTGHELSAREIEVLVLIQRTDQQRDRGQTEYRPDHRNHASEEHYRKAGHQIGFGPNHLCGDERVCGGRPHIANYVVNPW